MTFNKLDAARVAAREQRKFFARRRYQRRHGIPQSMTIALPPRARWSAYKIQIHDMIVHKLVVQSYE